MVHRSKANKNLLKMCAGDNPSFDKRVERIAKPVQTGIITRECEEISNLQKYMKGGKKNG